MLGPVACFTCGKRLGAYWESYNTLTNKYKNGIEEDVSWLTKIPNNSIIKIFCNFINTKNYYTFYFHSFKNNIYKYMKAILQPFLN